VQVRQTIAAAMAGAGAIGLAFLAADARAQTPPKSDGAAIYAERCAMCHDSGQAHVPTREALGRRSPSNISMALTSGAMMGPAKGLSGADIAAVGQFLTAEAAAKAEPLQPNLCRTPPAPLTISGPGWNGWGRDELNSRYQPHPGFAAADASRLRLKWAYAYPGALAWGQPTVVGGRVFVTSSSGLVISLDAKTGCTIWSIDAGAPVRTAISIGPGGKAARTIAYFGDISANVHAVDAETGRELWKTRLDKHPLARITGAPVLYQARLYTPVSSFEEGAASQADYPCCSFRGSVAALDAQSGKIVWQTPTISGPIKSYHRKGQAQGLTGPAGAAVWNTPTIDVRRGVLYVGTGNDYTDIDADTTDAILAFDLKSGKLRWSRQLVKLDHWEAGCVVGGVCPDNAGPDSDFAASPILVRLASGRDILLAGQKSGIVYGLDPAARGKVLWRARTGAGGVFGGIEWGMAATGRTVFAPSSDSMTEKGAKPDPGLTALDAATGQRLWRVATSRPECAWGTAECRGALSQAVSATPGLVFAGSQDGHLRAYRSSDGKLVWDYDTAVSVTPVNARMAAGGSLDAGGPVAVDGVVYVNSGYGQFFGRGGNVLLAFSVDGK
jgi:polyvinyl alcohol dehydrogenase (cytochrome)